MAKKSKKDDKPAKQSKGSGKPKQKSAAARISGELRKAAEPIVEMAGNPVMVELVASALIAGAQALSSKKPAKGAAETVVADAKAAGEKTGDIGSLLGYAVAVAAGEIADRLIHSYEAKAGGGKMAEQAAKAARKAADSAWNAVGKRKAPPSA